MQKTYIPGYRIDWRRVVTTHTRIGVNSLWWQSTGSTDWSDSVRCSSFTRSHFFQSRISLIIIYFLNWTLSELTSTLTYMQANTNAHETHGTNTQTHARKHAHTLFLIWPIKRCVFVNRENCRWCRHTHTQQLQCWAKLWRAQPKTTRDTYSITMSDSYSTTWNSLYRISTMQHYSILICFFFF